MAAEKRPYKITFNGTEHMVEATGPAQAVRHVVGASVTELRAAKGAEVAAWVRSGKTIEVAADKIVAAPVPATEQPVSAPPSEGLSDGEFYEWMLNFVDPRSDTVKLWQEIVSRQQMTLDQFDQLRAKLPVVNEVFADENSAVLSVDAFRARLEEQPMSLLELLSFVSSRALPAPVPMVPDPEPEPRSKRR